MDDFVPLANISRFLGGGIGLRAAYTVAVLVVYFNDRPYHGLPKIRKDENTWKAKQRWLSSARMLMNEELQKVRTSSLIVGDQCE